MSDYLGGVINGINDKTEEAFKYLYNTFYASLCRYANRFVGEFMDEEDVVQEIFVKLWEREGKFENMRAVSAYLYRSVHNACLVYIRDQKEKRQEEPDFSQSGFQFALCEWLVSTKGSGAAKRKSYKRKMEVRLKWVIPFQPVDDICPRCH